MNILFQDLIGYGVAMAMTNSAIMVLKYMRALTLSLDGFSGAKLEIAIVVLSVYYVKQLLSLKNTVNVLFFDLIEAKFAHEKLVQRGN